MDERPHQPLRLTAALHPHGHLASGEPSDATLAKLMRFAQWALDEAADGLQAGRIPQGRLEELAGGLATLSGLIWERARRGEGS